MQNYFIRSIAHADCTFQSNHVGLGGGGGSGLKATRFKQFTWLDKSIRSFC